MVCPSISFLFLTYSPMCITYFYKQMHPLTVNTLLTFFVHTQRAQEAAFVPTCCLPACMSCFILGKEWHFTSFSPYPFCFGWSQPLYSLCHSICCLGYCSLLSGGQQTSRFCLLRILICVAITT